MVEPLNEADIVAAINFSNRFNLRVVVKGTGKKDKNWEVAKSTKTSNLILAI